MEGDQKEIDPWLYKDSRNSTLNTIIWTAQKVQLHFPTYPPSYDWDFIQDCSQHNFYCIGIPVTIALFQGHNNNQHTLGKTLGGGEKF